MPTLANKYVLIADKGFAAQDYFMKERGKQMLDRSDAARIGWYGDDNSTQQVTAAKTPAAK